MLTLSVLTVLSVTLCAGAALERAPVVLDLRLPLAAAAYFLTVLLLRVLDEHKDFERDRQAYPGRLLSRGVVTLPELRRVGLVIGALAWACAAALGLASLVAYLVVFV